MNGWRTKVVCALGTSALACLGLVKSGVTQEVMEFSCSAFPSDISHAALIDRYGNDRVDTDFLQSLDDGPVKGTVVSFDSPGTRLEVGWLDPDLGTRPFSIRAFGPEWMTPQGIRIGTDLRTVEEMNGWPFRLGGLSWEPLGVVRSWGPRGRLQDEAIPGCRLAIHFQVSRDEVDHALVRQVSRGREFSSGHPAFQELNPTVAILRMYFPRMQ